MSDRNKRSQSWPPPPGQRWLVHVVVDMGAIAGVVALVLWGGLPPSAGAGLLVAIHAAYIAQARRPGPPSGAIFAALHIVSQFALKLKT